MNRNWVLNWDWQEWVVALILLLCILRIGIRLYTFLHGVKKKNNPCESCVSGCELKNQLDKKKQECNKNQLSEKEKRYI